ncbi:MULTISPECIES: phosphate signaling complex protein PhoU [Rhodomicrobium]|uniref:phosphate signaling complex protein PhoU n=1 Tax=Rhodomicrobium TaxID=1068 RepID=UPI000B4BA760|nr:MULTISPECIES: phosphate signaling complex protein PhoU [Rhodomicrobium]
MPTEHIVSAFEDELKALDTKIAQMGGLAEQLLGRAIDSLENRDPGLAEATIRQDEQIDRLEREVEELAISMIARRQPMAVDLRQIMTAVRVAGDLERVGDLGKNIAKRAMAIAAENRPKNLMIGIRHIGNKSLEQLTDVLNAYSQRDSEKALQVWRRDEELDAIYNSVFRELLTYMMEDPRNIGLCTHLLFGAKNLERIGDHATNIAEMIHFLVKGTPVTERRPKGDTTSFVMPESSTA